jgi:hypothetical protein
VNADLSVAPEIAQLAVASAAVRPGAAPRTDGRLAGDLAELAATPEHWWDLVRFDPAGPVRVPVPGLAGSWLLVLPPGADVDCDCQQATALAGEAAEFAGGYSRPLRSGRVRVHGAASQPGRPETHRLHAAGPGYSVTLHAGGPR